MSENSIYKKINCKSCSRAACVVTDEGISIRHTHSTEKHVTVLTWQQISSLLFEKGYVTLSIQEVAAKLAA